MSLYDEIINGTFSKGKTKIKFKDDSVNSLYEEIINGTFDAGKTKINFMNDEEDEKEEYKQDSQNWFKKSRAFEDEEGNVFTDTAQTVLGTLGDIGKNFTKGIMNIGEGIGDTISNARAQILENQGKTQEANEIRERIKENAIDDLFEGNLRVKENENSIADDIFNNFSEGLGNINKIAEENSILGDKSDSIVQGLGYVAGITAIGIASGGTGFAATAATTATTFTSAMGQGISQAYQEGANSDDAWKFGVISGLAEAGSELLFGGLGKASGTLGLSKGITSVDDALAKKVSGIFKTTLGKNLSEYVIKAGAEGTEEVISGFIQAIGQKLTYKSEEDLGKLIKDQNLLEQFVSGAITSAIAQVPGQNGIYKSTKNGRDFITNLTQNEAKVYDKELSNRVDEKVRNAAIEKAYKEQIEIQQKLGTELTEEKKNTIRQAVEDAYNSGRMKNEGKLSSKEYEELEKNVRRDLEEGNISLDTIRNTIGENQDISKDDFLKRSYYEEEQKNVIYQVQKTDNEKVNNLYQSAADAGMNNNNKTRKKVELVAKLTKDTDRQYKFASPEQLREMGYNENANGLIDKNTGEILINSHSDKGLQAIIGHETTHIFDSTDKNGKYTKEYEDLQKYAIEYAKEKGIYEKKIESITKAYGNLLENETQVNEELTADLVGDFLFNDEKFIENLSIKNRNVFQKIYDYIKHTLKLVTAGSEEARQLENLKYQFDKVYRTISEETNVDTKYSIGGIEAVNNIKKDTTLYNQAMNNYNKAKDMAKNNIDNEQIRQDTGWFQDKNGDWKFEFSDKYMSLKTNIKLKENTTYKLGDILEYDMLFTLYPELKNTEIKFTDLGKKNGSYSKINKDIRINKNKLNSNKSIEGTLIHEIQHVIQDIENFEAGSTTKKSKLKYFESLGEIEATDVKDRFMKEKYSNIDVSNIPPESSKNNPKHKGLSNYLKNRTLIDKMKDGLYNYFKNGGTESNEVFEEDNSKYKERNSTLVDARIKGLGDNENSNKSSFSMDNKGRKLSKEQQEYFKNSKVRDKNGNLKIVYHTTTETGEQFNEFNPVGTEGYRFGNQIVNYYTDSKTMSGSYADGKYEMADTKRISNIEEARQWLEKKNSILDNFTIEKQGEYYVVKNNDRPFGNIYFENETELLKNLKEKFNKYRENFGYNNHSRYQYEGYANIVNPYTIDAKGSNWNQIENGIVEYGNKLIEKLNILKENNLDYKVRRTFDKAYYDTKKSMEKYLNYTKKMDRIQNDIADAYARDGNNSFLYETPLYNDKDRAEFKKHENDKIDGKTLKEIGTEYYNNKYEKIIENRIKELKQNNPILKDISDEDLDMLYEMQMDESKIKYRYVKRVSTNDIVKDVIEQNKNGSNYDGVIIENVIDYGGTSESREPANLYITFNSNQFKNLDNINPTDNPDIRFSMTNDNKITGDDISVKDMLVKENSKSNTIEEFVGKNNENIDITEKTANENGSETNFKTKARNYISRSKTKFKNDVVAKFGTSKIANTNLLNSTVENIQNDIIDNGKLNSEQINNYFDELYDNLKKIDTAYYDEYKDVKKDIRNTKFYIPDNIRGDITDYNSFRQNNMGNLILTNNPENMNIDSKYQELSGMYPELFPDDIINQTDQLQRIAEVTKDIAKVETNVSAYNDLYMGKEYRKWAREEFGNAISNLTKDIHDAMRYNQEITTQDKINISKEEVQEVYKQLPAARKKYERSLAKEVLTKNDRIQVDRLLNGEIDINDLPKDSNQEGIIRLATAKAEYTYLQKSVDQYVKNIKQARIDEAQADVGDLNRWKDKKIGFQYSRETPIRNIYDVAPKEVADNIVNKYFRSYIEVNEKKVIDNINKYNKEIENLNIGTKKQYKIEYDGQKHKVSESALVQLFGENKITLNDIKESGADTTKIENAVSKFRSVYNELIDQINEAMFNNGYAPMEYRKDYFPHFTEDKSDTLLGKAAKLIGIDINNRDNLPTDISGQTMNFKPGRTWFSNMLQRTGDITDYDALKGFDKYIRGASDLIYHTDDIQKLRALSTVIRGTYNDTEIQNKVVEIQESTTLNDFEKSEAIQKIYDQAKDRSHLSKFIEWLDNYTNIIAGKKSINDRGSEKELNRKMYSTMQSVESRFAANAIGGNIGVALTNFAPLAQATGETKVSNLVAGMWQTMKASIKGDSSFASESQFITRRRGSEYLYQTNTDKITNLLTKPLEFVDNFTSETIVRAKYLQNIQEGMTEQTALEEADRYTAGLMADRGRGALPTQFNNRNPIAKMINMFQVEVNNQWSYYFKDLPRNVQENGKNNLVAAYSKIMIGSYLINEILGSVRGNSTRVLPDPIYIIKEFIKGLTDDDDDNDADTILSTLSEIAGNIPFVSLPATLLGADDVGRIPLSGMIPDLSDIVGNVTDVANDKKTLGEGAADISKELLDTLGSSLLLPFGGSQIKKTIKGLDLYSEDKPVSGSYTDKGDLRYTVDEDIGSRVKSALFGAYANPYAKDYIDSGYKTIKSNNIDELVALDMNSTEYRNYKKGLSKAGDTSDKNGYKQYTDNSGNIYWYDEDNEIMYDKNYKKTILSEDDLTKVSKIEEKLNYIDSLDISDEKKNIMANNVNKSSKKTIDMEEYSKYDSYEEYKYARDYPEKYSVISQIGTYDEFNEYNNEINKIEKEYKELSEGATSKQKTQISKQKKKEIQDYIESLPLNMYQKMMLEKEAAGYSIKNYKNQIYNYLEEQNLSTSEKYNIWNELFE